ncbi:MAG: hypothetical protein JNG89_17560 [Planctomycetaceae bacterium]|nr:hypothetical protein [Planctomycetaceae bacterium]
MNCTEFRAGIDAAVERRESPAAGLAAHLEQCSDAACRACWDDAQFLDPLIARWRRVSASIDVSDDVVNRCTPDIRRKEPRPAATAATSTAVGRAMAALVATALVLAVVFWLPSNAVAPGRVAVRNGAPRPPAERTMLADSSPGQEVGGDSGAAYVGYAQSAAQIMTDAVVLTLGDSNEMEDAKIAPGDIRWGAPWPQVGETMDSVLEEWFEGIPVEAPPS